MDDYTKLILIEFGEKIAMLLSIAESIKQYESIKGNAFEVGYLNGICKGLELVLMRIETRFK